MNELLLSIEMVDTGEHGVQLESVTFLLKDKREAHFS